MWITRFLKFCYMGSTKDAVFSVSLSLYISTMLIVSFLWSMKGSVTSFGQCVYCRFVLSISLLKFIQATVKQLPVLQWAYNYYSINDFYFLYLCRFAWSFKVPVDISNLLSSNNDILRIFCISMHFMIN